MGWGEFYFENEKCRRRLFIYFKFMSKIFQLESRKYTRI